MSLRTFLLTLAAMGTLTGGEPALAQDQTAFKPLRILAPKGNERTALQVEIAATPEAQERGLMGRTSLDPARGMLFVFPRPQMAHFWMRGTLIPLDMVFIDEAGRVTQIHPMAVPGDLTSIDSRVPVRAVLEMAGGQAAAQKISVGDRAEGVVFPASKEKKGVKPPLPGKAAE